MNAVIANDEWDEIAYRVSEYSFRPYILHNNIGQKLRDLQAGLDEQSRQNAELYITRILNLPDIETAVYCKVQRQYWETLSSEEYRLNTKEFSENLEDIKQQMKLVAGSDCYSEDVFWYHHGLKAMPQSVKDYIKNKDFIDGGSFVGDSALMLLKHYAPRRVYSFDISPKTIEGYLHNMQANAIDPQKYEVIASGLADKPGTLFINDTANQGTNLFSKGSFEAKVTDLDSFAAKRHLTVGYIKLDVEGAGLLALEGMKETIRKHRPVLSLAIYHTPEEYFDIKPRLEEIVDDYRFSIKQMNSPWNNLEIFLLGYPTEIER